MLHLVGYILEYSKYSFVNWYQNLRTEGVFQHCVLKTVNRVLCLIEDTHNHHQCKYSVIEL